MRNIWEDYIETIAKHWMDTVYMLWEIFGKMLYQIWQEMNIFLKFAYG